MAKTIYGEAMQNLWARILKQEIIKPGSTSLKALSLLETMTQREAQALQRACTLACTFGSDGANKLITGFRQPEQGVKRWFKPRFGRTPRARQLQTAVYGSDAADGSGADFKNRIGIWRDGSIR